MEGVAVFDLRLATRRGAYAHAKVLVDNGPQESFASFNRSATAEDEGCPAVSAP